MTLSRAVADVIRAEIDRRGLDVQAYAKRCGMPNTTAWRKLEGRSKIFVDDVPLFSEGLGWSPGRLVREAERLRGAGTPEVDAAMSRRGRRAVSTERDDRR